MLTSGLRAGRLALAFVLGLALPALSLTGSARAQGLEFGYDRPGQDYQSFDLPSADPQLCSNACANDGLCLAFTYVQPGVQGPNARCWLKSSVPPAVANNCCVSGVRQVALPGLEYGIDRPGMDYRSFDLATAAPQLCQSACASESQCRAFTYVQPGVQGPSARCWLKSDVPAQVANNCCISGVNGSAPMPPIGGGTIQVISATYGANCGAAANNVVNYIANECNGRQQCDYVVDYTKIGDPAPGCQKTYDVTWNCGGAQQSTQVGAEAGFGGVAKLHCP